MAFAIIQAFVKNPCSFSFFFFSLDDIVSSEVSVCIGYRNIICVGNIRKRKQLTQKSMPILSDADSAQFCQSLVLPIPVVRNS